MSPPTNCNGKEKNDCFQHWCSIILTAHMNFLSWNENTDWQICFQILLEENRSHKSLFHIGRMFRERWRAGGLFFVQYLSEKKVFSYYKIVRYLGCLHRFVVFVCLNGRLRTGVRYSSFTLPILQLLLTLYKMRYLWLQNWVGSGRVSTELPASHSMHTSENETVDQMHPQQLSVCRG